MNPQTVKIICQ